MGSREAAEKQFLEYNWENSEAWQKFFSNLYPTPPAVKVDKWKRKFFKNSVNSALDIETPNPTAADTHNESSTTDATPSTTTPTSMRGRSNMRLISTSLRVPALLMSLIYLFPRSPKRVFLSAVWLHIAANLALIGAKFGRPKFQAEWMQTVMADDSVLSLFFAFTAFSVGDTFLSLASPCISSVIHFADAYRDTLKVYVPPKIDNTVTTATDRINSSRYGLMQFRANIEVMLGLLVLVGLCTGRSGGLSVLLYGNALRTAYSMSAFTKSTFSQVHVLITNVLTHGAVPVAVNAGYQKVSGMLHSYANQGTQPPPPQRRAD
eukprot:Lankesteria_metandrocarpae@DN9337_c0_g1_i1.p1